MVSFMGGGWGGVSKKVKNAEIKGGAATFLSLGCVVVILWWGCTFIGRPKMKSVTSSKSADVILVVVRF